MLAGLIRALPQTVQLGLAATAALKAAVCFLAYLGDVADRSGVGLLRLSGSGDGQRGTCESKGSDYTLRVIHVRPTTPTALGHGDIRPLVATARLIAGRTE